MVLRGLCLFGLALWAFSDTNAQPNLDLTVTPAWKGWSRPGRATEVDVRLRSGSATRTKVAIVAGRQTVRSELDLEPGRVVRMHVPVGPAEHLAVTVGPQNAPSERHDVSIAQSELPLLGAGLATGAPVGIDGFHTVVLDAEDLPRNASAYASIDALIVDAPTLGALDQRQLGALLAYITACGRTALVNPDPRARGVLEGAAGCGGRFLVSAASPGDAAEMLEASLAVPRTSVISLAVLGDLARPDDSTWNRVLALLAAYFCAAALVVAFSSYGVRPCPGRESPDTRPGSGFRASRAPTRGCRPYPSSERSGPVMRACQCASTSTPPAASLRLSSSMRACFNTSRSAIPAISRSCARWLSKRAATI